MKRADLVRISWSEAAEIIINRCRYLEGWYVRDLVVCIVSPFPVGVPVEEGKGSSLSTLFEPYRLRHPISTRDLLSNLCSSSDDSNVRKSNHGLRVKDERNTSPYTYWVKSDALPENMMQACYPTNPWNEARGLSTPVLVIALLWIRPPPIVSPQRSFQYAPSVYHLLILEHAKVDSTLFLSSLCWISNLDECSFKFWFSRSIPPRYMARWFDPRFCLSYERTSSFLVPVFQAPPEIQ